MVQNKKYHHGDLKSKLFDMVLDCVKSKSLNEFSLRKAARAIGVSPAAPYNHFSDKKALIEYSILKCRSVFIKYLKDNSLDTINNKNDLSLIGKLYLIYASKNPELFIFMFSNNINADEKSKFYSKLKILFEQSIRDNIGEKNLRKKVSLRSAVYSAWTMVHGTACFIANGNIIENKNDGKYLNQLFEELSVIWAVGVSRPLVIK